MRTLSIPRVAALLLFLAFMSKAAEAPPPAPPPVTDSPLQPAVADALPGASVSLPQQEPLDSPQSDPLSVWKESADSLDHVTLSVSSGYSVLVSGPQIEGSGAFHLVHPNDVSTQTITLNPSFAVGADTKLFFESRLGTATASQVAEVQISTNDGASWTLIWSQAGLGQPGQTAFQRQEVALADWEGQTVRIRFRYRFSGGSYFPQTSLNMGWLIDDIQVGEVYEITPVIYSIGEPTGLEQQNLEWINRARQSAPAEAVRLRDTDDPDVVSAMNFFDVDKVLLVEQFGELTETVPPLAWNAQLIAAARLHSLDMLNNSFQGHSSSADPPEPNQPFDTMVDRLSRQGYDYATAGENVYAYAKSNWHAHAGFNIDWGSGSQGSIGGMQNPPGHRLAIHSANFREIGIGILEGSNGPVGPMLVTQNFGTRQSMNTPFITGVAWQDLNENGEYDPGEGLGGIGIRVDGQRFMAVTSSSGGFAIPVFADGSYTVRFQSEDHPDWISVVEVSGGQNVKIDYQRETIPIPTLSAPQTAGAPGGAFTLSVTGAFIAPGLQYSDDLDAWHSIMDLSPENLGNQTYQFTLPPPPDGARFYRIVFP